MPAFSNSNLDQEIKNISATNANQPKFHAFQVSDQDGKPSFNKVGAAWENQSGGLNIRLDDEFSGDIYSFPPKPRKARTSTGKKATAAASK